MILLHLGGNMSLSKIQDQLIGLYARTEYISFTPQKVSTSHPDHKAHNYFNSSLNRMRFARRCMHYKVTNEDGGWIVKEMVYDLTISEVAIREMIKDSLDLGTLEKIEHTNRFRMTNKSREMYLKYMLLRMEQEREGYEAIGKLLQTMYTYQDLNKNS